MEKIDVKIIIGDRNFNISDDIPDFSELLNYVIENQSVDLNQIQIECNNEDFDKKIFREIIIEAFTEIKENLKINEEKIQLLLSSCDIEDK